MKQVLHNLGNGETLLVDVPAPKSAPGQVLIRTHTTLISAGTERMLVAFGKANWLEKARQQPDKVNMVLEKIKTEGLIDTIEAVKSKLDQPLPLGYCNVGTVLESNCTELEVGDRVVSNGHHAEVVRVAKNLCAAIPETVDDQTAAFAVVGAIGLQGVRLAKPTIGECFVVIGLGLIGLITVQILKANGCRVLGIDLDSAKCKLAREFGAETVDLANGEDPIKGAQIFSRGNGVDGVLITASTKSDEPVHQAAEMCRKRGRIVLVGVVGLKLSRADFYEKELSFQVSCSYGPGRYDNVYEQQGVDYPIGHVRWTEQRNLEAVLDLMAADKIKVESLISARFKIDQAVEALGELEKESSLGLLLEYPSSQDEENLKGSVVISSAEALRAEGNGVCAFVGAGNYASRILIPAFKNAGATLHTIVSDGGVSGVYSGKKYGFQKASTGYADVLLDDGIDTVVIATRHNLHAAQVLEALKAGKHVFVEKPLALTPEDISLIEKTAKKQPEKIFMVGFNRRFAPLIQRMADTLRPIREPKTFIMTMNAGKIPADHWTQDPIEGGGRLVGEACHYIDLMRFLAGAKITGFTVTTMGHSHAHDISEDKATITMRFEDGSFGSIHYLANGGKSFPKERIEVFCSDFVLQLANFRSLRGYGVKGFKNIHRLTQDKGQNACAKAFLEAVNGKRPPPIAIKELVEVSKVAVEIAEAARQGN